MSYKNLDELLGESLEKVAKVGAIILNGHFVYTSGKHGASYINKDAIYPYSHLVNNLCRVLAWRLHTEVPDAVVAPAVGAVILSQWMGYHLTNMCMREVLSLYADKEGAGFVIRRGYEKLVPNRRIIVIEDLFTTGGSAAKVVSCVRQLGGEVIAVGGLANRGAITCEDVGMVPRLETLMQLTMEDYDPEHCPLCKRGIPINTSLGHGKVPVN